ncbi:MAG: efflux RND transporter periplasmic adaptor subunit [Candidatus Uhrbacteria bacterium]
MTRRFFLRPWFIVGVIIIGIVIIVLVLRGRGTDVPTYDTVTAAYHDVLREVDVTGAVEPSDEVSLAFEIGGRIARVPAKVGDAVVPRAALVVLDQTDVFAERAQAQAVADAERARLAELRVGTRAEQLHVKEIDLDNSRRALEDAERNLAQVRDDATASLRVQFEKAPNTLNDAYTYADDAVRKQVDVLFENDATDNPQLTYQTADFQSEIDAERMRRDIEKRLIQLEAGIAALDRDVNEAQYERALIDAADHLAVIRTFLERLAATLNAKTGLSDTVLATYKGYVSTTRTNVNTALTNVTTLDQAIDAQRHTNDGVVNTGSTAVTTARNAYHAAEAALALAKAGSTMEQIAAQEALVAKAVAALSAVDAKLAKTILRAPFAGTVTIQNATVGALAVAATPLVTLISSSSFEIRAQIPEVDLDGLAPGQSALVTFDAYGSGAAFPATVASIDPAATLIDGMPTYETTLVLDTFDERIRSGLTADVMILVERREHVIAIPQRAVVRTNGSAIVRVLRNGEVVEIPVVLGLSGSDGYAEILEGLADGDVVIRSLQDS